jgi:hypothetical protein
MLFKKKQPSFRPKMWLFSILPKNISKIITFVIGKVCETWHVFTFRFAQTLPSFDGKNPPKSDFLEQGISLLFQSLYGDKNTLKRCVNEICCTMKKEKKSQIKSKWLTVRLTKEEYEKNLKNSKKIGQNFNQVVRYLQAKHSPGEAEKLLSDAKIELEKANKIQNMSFKLQRKLSNIMLKNNKK